MRRAMALAATVRSTTAPNPWVGCVVVPPAAAPTPSPSSRGRPRRPAAPTPRWPPCAAAGEAARGATLYSTLEPCAHHGRTPPCTDAIIAAGVARVVVGIEDPDPQVAGRGVAALRAAGIEVDRGRGGRRGRRAARARTSSTARTGRPWVVLKMAASLDGRTAAPDGTSRWITGRGGPPRRAPAAGRAPTPCWSGAGTVRADDPELTVRLDDGAAERQPLRVVLGRAPAGARVHPALELAGDLGDVLDELGRRGVLQVLVEGGARVAHDFHAAGLVDRYVLYLAPALFGGDDGRPLFAGPGLRTIGDVWRGRLVSVEQLGEDLRVEVAA